MGPNNIIVLQLEHWVQSMGTDKHLITSVQ